MSQVEIQKIKDDIAYIKKVVAGNGEKGLIKTVELLRETIGNIQIVLTKLEGNNHLKNWILGGMITILSGICGALLMWIVPHLLGE